MARYLGDVNARARGLRTHLLGRADFERLARAPSVYALQRDLGTLGLVRADCPARPEQLERDVRRHAAVAMSLLTRWSGEERRPLLAVIFEEEDRRAVLALLRGAAQAAAPEARLAGLLPTEHLPERALRLLAEQPTVGDVVRLLLLTNHPFAAALAVAARGPHPSLFHLEVALHRAFASVALRHARRGGPALRAHAHETVDLMNLWSAVLHAPERDPALVDLAFVQGGALLTREHFVTLMGLKTSTQMAHYLVHVFRSSPLGEVFREAGDRPASWEAATLRAQIEQMRREARLDPSGAAPILGYALELRAQVFALGRIVWGVALQAPPALLYGEGVLA